MKFLIVLTLTFISTNLTCGQGSDCRIDSIEQIIFCNEKFKEDTKRDYTGYSGCLIEKQNPPESSKFFNVKQFASKCINFQNLNK